MSIESINLTPELYSYLHKMSLREPEILKELRQETGKLKSYMMQISPEQGQFMALLIELIGANKTLEIGTFTGYSALVVALALPLQGKLITCDINMESTKIAKQFWERAGVANKVELKIGPALTTLQQLIENGETNTFDFVFIDADKANYVSYYEKSLDLAKPGGLIAVDNVLWHGKVANKDNQDKDTQAIRELNEKIFSDQRVTISLIPIGDGLTLARKR